MFSDIFIQLLQERELTAYRLSRETGIPSGMISKWRSGAQLPSAENLTKLADYFRVSIDYLLGRTQNPGLVPDELSPDERRLLDDYRSLTHQGKELILMNMVAAKSAFKKSAHFPDMEAAGEISP